jgi:hypothetical protein
MSVSKAALLEFLRLHRYAVEASQAAEGPPEAALVGFLVNERLELFFDSFDSTRKVANLRRDPRIAFVIGGQTIGDERTVQYEGVVDAPIGAELQQFKRDYFAIQPDGLRRSKLPGITYFRVRPRWIRHSDFNVNPAEIVVFEGAALSADYRAEQHSVTRERDHLDEPWQPKIEREAAFNPFTNPRDGTGGSENPAPLEGLE